MSRETTYLVIGGGLAAREAVKALRKADAEGSIMLVNQEPHLPYDRPPLTKDFLQGKKTREDIEYDTAAFYAENRIETVLGTEVTALRPDEHEAELADGTVIGFRKALIATGGRVVKLPVPGADQAGVHYLRTVDDAQGIAADAGPGRKAVVVGGGFIGLEVASSLTKLGCEATVVEAGPWIWRRFADEALATSVMRYCESQGVRFALNARVSGIAGDGQATGVQLASGEVLPADLVCVGIGIRPNVELAQAAGLTVENGIVADACMTTSHPDVFAAGDVVNFPDAFSGQRKRVEHWSHANASGRTAALAMAGQPKPYDALGFVWSDIFDYHLKFLGDHDQHEATVLRGTLDADAYTLFYLKGGRVTGCFAVNGEPREFGVIRRLVSAKTDVSERQTVLADPGGDLKSLL